MFFSIFEDKPNLLESQKTSGFLLHQIDRYTAPIRSSLDQHIDKRLVRTFFDLFSVILMFRNRAMGLLLSELGGYICGFSHAPAGTKRISNLLRSKKWSADLIDHFLFSQIRQEISKLVAVGKRPLFLWDDSRIEKAESWSLEGLCSVWSSKAKRLTQIRRGFYRPPRGRICVPGFKWTGVFLSHVGGIPRVCQMSWWTTRGKFKKDPDNIIYRLLRKVHQQIEQAVVHVMDRGYASEKIIRYMLTFEQDFIIRWKKNILLTHPKKGEKQTHQISRSLKSKAQRVAWDKVRKQYKRIAITWTALTHPQYPDYQLFLVVIRDKKNYNSPMYILTSLPIQTAKDAWEILACYMNRWEAEQGFRFLKAELGLESPRLWTWENRQKLMAIVTLVYDFLLQMLQGWERWIKEGFFRKWCHRTGKKCREANIPIYRLRMAIAHCLTIRWAVNMIQIIQYDTNLIEMSHLENSG